LFAVNIIASWYHYKICAFPFNNIYHIWYHRSLFSPIRSPLLLLAWGWHKKSIKTALPMYLPWHFLCCIMLAWKFINSDKKVVSSFIGCFLHLKEMGIFLKNL
jgi:hypothetical protein